MNGGLTIDVDRADPVVTLRPRGVLDAYVAPDLRAALLEAVAEQRDGVIVDVSDLTVTDDVGLAVVATVAQQNRHWPGIGLVLAGGSPEFAAAADRMGITAYVGLCPDRQAALTALAQQPAPARRREDITPDRNAPSAARAAVQEFCAAQGIDGNTEAAQLIASELITNAVVHAGTPIVLTLRLVSPLLHIAVRDTGPGEVHITGLVDEAAESGRGLVLVDALAASWGTFVPSSGKIVWATVRVRRSF